MLLSDIKTNDMFKGQPKDMVQLGDGKLHASLIGCLAQRPWPALDHPVEDVRWRMLVGEAWRDCIIDDMQTVEEFLSSGLVGSVETKDGEIIYVGNDSVMDIDGFVRDGRIFRSVVEFFCRLKGGKVEDGDFEKPMSKFLYPEGVLQEKRFYRRVNVKIQEKVWAIEKQAKSLGWSDGELFGRSSDLKFPVGGDWGLVCFLEAEDRIDGVEKEGIKIIKKSGVTQVFGHSTRKRVAAQGDGLFA